MVPVDRKAFNLLFFFNFMHPCCCRSQDFLVQTYIAERSYILQYHIYKVLSLTLGVMHKQWHLMFYVMCEKLHQSHILWEFLEMNLMNGYCTNFRKKYRKYVIFICFWCNEWRHLGVFFLIVICIFTSFLDIILLSVLQNEIS